MNIRFTKMQGLGNDFILIDCIAQACPFTFDDEQIINISKHLCDRRFGIGADQILLLYPSKTADFKMTIFNADGSEVEMCGNGIRCLAKYVWDRGLSYEKILSIETLAGIIKPEKAGDLVKVDMGEPIFEPERIPVNVRESEIRNQILPLNSPVGMGGNKRVVIDYPLRIEDREFKISSVSMGNPHAIIIVDDVSEFPVTYYGPRIETHPIFPKRTNVEFIQALSDRELKMRVWERGSGETLACGTGASASAVAANLKGLTGRSVTIHLPGGDLLIDWAEDNHVYMTGPAAEVFKGVIELS
jgi:diaminopimelate epimerase